MLFNGSNGSISDVQWTCPVDPMALTDVHWSIWVDPMDTITKPSLASDHQSGVFVQWIHWTPLDMSIGSIGSITYILCTLNIVSIKHRVNWTLCPLDPLSIVSIKHCVHWTSCPLNIVSIGSIVSIGHRVQWTLCPLNIVSIGNRVHRTSCPLNIVSNEHCVH